MSMGLAGGSTTGAGFEAGIGLMPGVELILGVLPYEWLFAVLIARRGGLFVFGLRRLYRSVVASPTRYYYMPSSLLIHSSPPKW